MTNDKITMQVIAKSKTSACIAVILMPILVMLIHVNYVSKHYNIREVASGSAHDYPYLQEVLFLISMFYLIATGWYRALISIMGGDKCIFIKGNKLYFITISGYRSLNISDITNIHESSKFIGKYLTINTETKSYNVAYNLMDILALDQANLIVSHHRICSLK